MVTDLFDTSLDPYPHPDPWPNPVHQAVSILLYHLKPLFRSFAIKLSVPLSHKNNLLECENSYLSLPSIHHGASNVTGAQWILVKLMKYRKAVAEAQMSSITLDHTPSLGGVQIQWLSNREGSKSLVPLPQGRTTLKSHPSAKASWPITISTPPSVSSFRPLSTFQ